jgi:hypothetical protein
MVIFKFGANSSIIGILWYREARRFVVGILSIARFPHPAIASGDLPFTNCIWVFVHEQQFHLG